MKKLWTILLCAALACSAAGCGGKNTAQPADSGQAPLLTFTDDLGREVRVKSADRVAVLIGSFADVWCLAGGHDSIVAAADDTWTSFDLDLGEDVLDLGGIKEPNTELLLSARPDFVIASSNTAADMDMMDTLERAGIPAAYFDVQGFSDYLNMLDICCRITGHSENYDLYGTQVAVRVDAAKARQDGSAPTVLCIRATGVSCTVKKSTDNLLGEMLADLGCVNVADGGDTALENLSMEAVMAADPDYIFAVLQGADATDAENTLQQTLLSNPAWSSLRAVQSGQFYTLDNSLYNLKPNARWGEAYEKLADILYP